MKKFLIGLLGLMGVISLSNVQYNVFIDFDKKTENNIAKISHSLKDVDIESLYYKGYKEHLTLYLTEYKEGKEVLENIKKVIDETAKNLKPFKIEFIQIRDTSHLKDYSGWLMLDSSKEINLQNLADKIADKLISLRATDAEIPSWAKNIPVKAEGFRKYGSPNVYENFDPHITLNAAPYSNKYNLSQFFRNYPFEKFKGTVKGIGVMEADSFGQGLSLIHI